MRVAQPESGDFSVVVITRNRPAILCQCLQHLAMQSQLPAEILVIDSSDNFTPVTGDRVRHVHFPAGRQQMPKARNQGIQLAHTSYVAFIDDDCLVDGDWLEKLIVAYREHPDLAGAGGRISDHRWHFDPKLPVGSVTSDGKVISNFFGDPGGVVEVCLLPGGNMSFRREDLLAVGGFDPNYIATNHREDPDLCLRLLSRGGRLAFQPAAHALHLNARNSLGELRPWHEVYLRFSFGRNEAYFLARHFPQAIFHRWIHDTLQQLGRSWRAKSIVDGLCTIVQTSSFGLGLLSYLFWGRNVPRGPGAQTLLQGGCLF